MIVVETSTSASPREELAASCPRARAPPSGRARRGSARSGRAAAASRPPPRSSRRGCAGRTPGPSRASSRSSACLISSSSYSPTYVRIGRRPSGGVSITEMSRSPASDMWSVRGIGVALSASTSTSSRSWRSSSFCATPKRCSSSTTTRPSSFGITSRESTRCVPIRTSTLPSANSREHLLRPRPACGSARPSRRAPGSRGSARGTCSSAAARAPSSARASAPACR